MEIVLSRHGKSALPRVSSISGRDLGRWVDRYNAAGITTALPPPEPLRQLATSVGYVVASDRRRAVESARWLASSREFEVDPKLREAALPDSMGVSLQMSPDVWAIIARVVWSFDWHQSSESVAAARRRAKEATARLCALAGEHRTVLVVGHGMFNRLIARELRRRGWRGPRFLPLANWTSATYARPEPS